MKHLSRKNQKIHNFMKKGIGSESLPKIDYVNLLSSTYDNYNTISTISTISQDPIHYDVEETVDYCKTRIPDSLYNNNEWASHLYSYSAQPIINFIENDEYGYNRRKEYFWKNYLYYSNAFISNWSGLSGFSGLSSGISGVSEYDLFPDLYPPSAIVLNIVKENIQPIVENNTILDDFERQYQLFIEQLRFEKEYNEFIKNLTSANY